MADRHSQGSPTAPRSLQNSRTDVTKVWLETCAGPTTLRTLDLLFPTARGHCPPPLQVLRTPALFFHVSFTFGVPLCAFHSPRQRRRQDTIPYLSQAPQRVYSPVFDTLRVPPPSSSTLFLMIERSLTISTYIPTFSTPKPRPSHL